MPCHVNERSTTHTLLEPLVAHVVMTCGASCIYRYDLYSCNVRVSIHSNHVHTPQVTRAGLDAVKSLLFFGFPFIVKHWARQSHSPGVPVQSRQRHIRQRHLTYLISDQCNVAASPPEACSACRPPFLPPREQHGKGGQSERCSSCWQYL